MNEYEAKQQARRERYEARAQDARQESAARYNRAHEIADGIPFGQPILVGHHSERGHRADLKRIDNNMRASIEADEKAAHYERKAAGVGHGGISSDDPEALQKLRSKLKSMEENHAAMKAANKIVHEKPKNQCTDEKIARLMALGFNSRNAEELFKADFCGRIGFPAYAFTNNSGNMRRVRQRIEQLEAVAEHEDVEQAEGAITYREADNRVQLIFPGKPAEDVRKLLKSHGFRWAPSNGAWQRHLNPSGQYMGRFIIEQLKDRDPADLGA